MRIQRVEVGMGVTDLFPKIVPWVCCGPSFGRLGWAKGPGVSRPSSRFGGAVEQQGGVQRLTLMARIFLSASVLAGTRNMHRHHRLPPSPGSHGFAVFNRRVHVVVRTWSGIIPGRLIVGEK